MGAYEATKHLIAQGRKRIIHVTGDMNYTASLERLNGFVRAMRDSHIPITADSIPGETAVIGFDDDTPDSRDIIFPNFPLCASLCMRWAVLLLNCYWLSFVIRHTSLRPDVSSHSLF